MTAAFEACLFHKAIRYFLIEDCLAEVILISYSLSSQRKAKTPATTLNLCMTEHYHQLSKHLKSLQNLALLTGTVL